MLMSYYKTNGTAQRFNISWTCLKRTAVSTVLHIVSATFCNWINYVHNVLDCFIFVLSSTTTYYMMEQMHMGQSPLCVLLFSGNESTSTLWSSISMQGNHLLWWYTAFLSALFDSCWISGEYYIYTAIRYPWIRDSPQICMVQKRTESNFLPNV